ncbi:tRNA-splicing ligase RtcB, putative [Angomonas deanei]|uniref:3'-phosphate/5'-hydroxy nucleic acid ligase n=1 Tax=Angomonas deanei TaxID=59799 RepID=A0A7G2C239_9TRYP|nr:tRNA-splicing ligase RtcB, putative [Angomonas deanei]
MFSIPNSADPSDPIVVHLAKEYVDEATRQQIESMCGHPAVQHARIMPDCHKGSGTCVGFTCCLTPVMSPGLIGGDIGCGVSAVPLPASLMKKRNGTTKLKRAIHATIPMGNGQQNVHREPIIAEEQYDDFYQECNELALRFAQSYKEKFPAVNASVDILHCMPTYSREWTKQRCEQLGLSYRKDYLCCMGTLGGGNHFVEVDCCEEDYLLVVHSGSRALGQAIYRYWSQYVRHRVSGGGAEKVSHTAHAVDDDDESADFDKNFYLSGEMAYQYIFDMIWAQKYAEMNRLAMLSSVLAELGLPFDSRQIIQSVHNYIDFEDLIVRKGAIRAHEGEKCIVALNMRDGILVGEGLGKEEWNASAAHGCGRVLPRGVAGRTKGTKKDLEVALQRFKAEMGDVDSDTITADTIDERPSAYRDPSIVLEALHDTISETSARRYVTVVSAKGGK